MSNSAEDRHRPTVEDIEKQARAFHKLGYVGSLTIERTRLSYWRSGDAPDTILFIHGNSASKEVFHQQFACFHGPHLSLLAIDLPGHGASADAAARAEQYTIPGYARLITRALDAMGVRRPLVVGWSLGGHVALEMAGQGCDLAGILIVGTPPAGPGADELAAAFRAHAAAAITTKRNASEQEVRAYVSCLYGRLDPIPDLFFKTALRTDGRAREIMGAHWSAGGDGCRQRDVIETWKGPLSVVHGMEDPFVSYDYLKELRWRALWQGRILEFPDCGHAPFLEDPDAFNAILADFSGDVFRS